MSLIRFDDPRAIALREWLLDNYSCYVKHPDLLSDTRLSFWLTEAETNEGVVEIPAHRSASRHTVTYHVPLDADHVEVAA